MDVGSADATPAIFVLLQHRQGQRHTRKTGKEIIIVSSLLTLQPSKLEVFKRENAGED